MSVKIALLVMAALLAGCGPAVTPVSLSTPEILKVQSSPVLADKEPDFHDCASQAGLSLILTDEEPDLTLRWGPPTGWNGYAAVLGQEQWVVLTHPGNPLEQISPQLLQSIYTGQIKTWQQAGWPTEAENTIHAWAYPAGSDTQQVFERSLLEHPLAGGLTFIAPEPSALLESVAQDPAAIGFAPRHWVNDQVKPLEVTGLESAQITQPILALRDSEPLGSSARWLACLQGRLTELGKED